MDRGSPRAALDAPSRALLVSVLRTVRDMTLLFSFFAGLVATVLAVFDGRPDIRITKGEALSALGVVVGTWTVAALVLAAVVSLARQRWCGLVLPVVVAPFGFVVAIGLFLSWPCLATFTASIACEVARAMLARRATAVIQARPYASTSRVEVAHGDGP